MIGVSSTMPGNRCLLLFPALLAFALPLRPPPAAGEAAVVPVRPALHWAAANGLTDIARLLIEQGAAVNGLDNFENTPLHLAVAYPAMLELLLQGGAKVNARNAFGHTPLHLAVGDRRAVEILLAAGADVRARNGFGKTPLDYAMRQGTSAYYLGIVELLIRAGAR
jgi:ankyrin repeat protein